MDSALNTSVQGFLLQGFSEFPRLRPVLFLLLLAAHVVTVAGNLLILAAVAAAPHRPPMLLFLGQLSAIELGYTLVVAPRALADLAVPGPARAHPISRAACAAQMQLFVALGGAECFLLAAMAYDRYVAICHPLRYPAVVTPALCARLALACCLGGLAVSLGLVAAVFRLPFCGPRVLVHFFCDITALLHVACTHGYVDELPLLGACTVLLLLPAALILASYSALGAALRRLRAPGGRRKAATTCASHLAVTFLHYGCATFMYVRPKAAYAPRRDRTLALVYTSVTPLLYPLIYSLRNREVTAGLRRALAWRRWSIGCPGRALGEA
ncbi:PREDICTED: putative olfactory receptor 10AC1-like [Elephantulus edwardii]|uniref:putative olfactory receptor 10AC1-like n=1 Tax=Elephantulus edwardii TaxID=28737 RepID=UPI0003F06211|nr:PREDICTED: putative olfactory receptor 10AC1-like [Elephantulus edwardii]